MANYRARLEQMLPLLAQIENCNDFNVLIDFFADDTALARAQVKLILG